MKFHFLSSKIIICIFLVAMPTHPAQNRVQTLISGFNQGSKPASSAQKFIATLPQDRDIKSDILTLLYWDAHINNKKTDIPIYQQALYPHQSKPSTPWTIYQGEIPIPNLKNPDFSPSASLDNDLQEKVSRILEDIKTAKITNFNVRIERKNSEISNQINRLGLQKDHLKSVDQKKLDDLINNQLSTIRQKIDFTGDASELEKDMKKISPFRSYIRNSENLELLQQLRNIIAVQSTSEDIFVDGFPLTEALPEQKTKQPRETQSETPEDKELSIGSTDPLSPENIEQTREVALATTVINELTNELPQKHDLPLEQKQMIGITESSDPLQPEVSPTAERGPYQIRLSPQIINPRP